MLKRRTVDGDEMNFQNPNTLDGGETIKQPMMLNCQLKEYQVKGLTWLASLYDQGINGILADEMVCRSPFASMPRLPSVFRVSARRALAHLLRWRSMLTSSQTVQSIALMAHLAETQNIWGPFLVIAPASTLHNWQQEISRFVPSLKALPYWGAVKDRTVLRKFWNRKAIRYDKDAPFHILVTSYQLVHSLLALRLSMHADFRTGRRRRKVLPAGQMAVHGPRRSASDQVLLFRSVEDTPRLPLSQSTPPDRHTDSELDAGTVGVASLHHAEFVRLA